MVDSLLEFFTQGYHWRAVERRLEFDPTIYQTYETSPDTLNLFFIVDYPVDLISSQRHKVT